MTITIPHFAVPCILTLIIWLAANFWPLKSNSDYGIGAAVDALVVFVIVMFSTAVVWIVYLTIRLWMS